jgi:hypothetical protein
MVWVRASLHSAPWALPGAVRAAGQTVGVENVHCHQRYGTYIGGTSTSAPRACCRLRRTATCHGDALTPITPAALTNGLRTLIRACRSVHMFSWFRRLKPTDNFHVL